MLSAEQTVITSVADRHIPKSKPEVSLSLYSFLFSELFSYCRKGVDNVPQLHLRLNLLGRSVGASLHELVCYRERPKRETTILGVLHYLQSTFWKSIFGRPADSLERGSGTEGQYLLWENASVVAKFITVPKDFPSLSVCAFTAGMIRGVLDALHMAAEVSALPGADAGGAEGTTVYVIEFAPTVVAREKKAVKAA